MDKIATQTINAYQQAKEQKISWEPLFNECFRYFLPQVEYYESSGSKQKNTLYDSTGVLALQSFASSLKHSLLPAWQRWCEIVAPVTDSQVSEVELNQKIEETVTNPLFNALHHSNFDVEVSQSLLELGIGTGALLINEGSQQNPLIFSAIPIRDLVLEEGPLGSIETVYRQQNLKQSMVSKFWPKIKFDSNSTPDTVMSILEATVFNPDLKNYHYLIIDLNRQQILFEDNFKVSPWVIFRWSKVAGETYGRGPAMQCLPDIKEANKIKELTLQNAVLNVVPTYMVASDGVINPHTLKIRPGGIIPVRGLQGGSPIMPLPRGGDLGTTQVMLEQAREVVRQTLFNDRLGSTTGAVRSATELVIRNQSLVKDIGAAFGRLQTELVQKLVNRCLDILQKKGLAMPLQTDGVAAVLNVTSPLAKLQNQSDLNALVQLLPFADRFPDEFRLGLKTELMPEWIAKRTGVSARLIRNNDEKNKIARYYQKQATAGNAGAEPSLVHPKNQPPDNTKRAEKIETSGALDDSLGNAAAPYSADMLDNAEILTDFQSWSLKD